MDSVDEYKFRRDLDIIAKWLDMMRRNIRSVEAEETLAAYRRLEKMGYSQCRVYEIINGK